MSSSTAVVAAARDITYLGMDVHKDSITIAVLPSRAKGPTRLDRLPNDAPKLKKWMARVARDGELRACYEASGAGYVFQRAMREWGYACDVIAPSLIPKRPGVPRSTTSEMRPTPATSCRNSVTGSATAIDLIKAFWMLIASVGGHGRHLCATRIRGTFKVFSGHLRGVMRRPCVCRASAKRQSARATEVRSWHHDRSAVAM